MRFQKPRAEFPIGKNEHQCRMVMKSQGAAGLRTDTELDKGRTGGIKTGDSLDGTGFQGDQEARKCRLRV